MQFCQCHGDLRYGEFIAHQDSCVPNLEIPCRNERQNPLTLYILLINPFIGHSLSSFVLQHKAAVSTHHFQSSQWNALGDEIYLFSSQLA